MVLVYLTKVDPLLDGFLLICLLFPEGSDRISILQSMNHRQRIQFYRIQIYIRVVLLLIICKNAFVKGSITPSIDTFPISLIIFVLSLVDFSIFEVMLPPSVLQTLTKITIIGFVIGPCVYTLTIEMVIFELPLVDITILKD